MNPRHSVTKSILSPIQNSILEFIVLPLCWIVIYALAGTYNDIYRKSRLREFAQTFYISAFGVLIIFFTLLLDDFIGNYRNYYHTITALFVLHFFLTASFRFGITTSISRKLKSRKIGYPTLLIGSNQKALQLYKELEEEKTSQGYRFLGFVHVDHNNGKLLGPFLPNLGGVDELKDIIRKHSIVAVIMHS